MFCLNIYEWLFLPIIIIPYNLGLHNESAILRCYTIRTHPALKGMGTDDLVL